MASSSTTFDYSSLKELLKDSNAEVLLPNDGQAYEKSIERWSEHCIKRAVGLHRSFFIFRDNGHKES